MAYSYQECLSDSLSQNMGCSDHIRLVQLMLQITQSGRTDGRLISVPGNSAMTSSMGEPQKCLVVAFIVIREVTYC